VRTGVRLPQAGELSEAGGEAWNGSLPCAIRESMALPAP